MLAKHLRRQHRRAYLKKWYQANRERILASQAQRRLARMGLIPAPVAD